MTFKVVDIAHMRKKVQLMHYGVVRSRAQYGILVLGAKSLKWCDIPVPTIQRIEDFLTFVMEWGNCEKRRRDLMCICYGAIWLIWKARCDWVFKKTRSSPTKVADNVKSILYTWLKYRRSKCFYNWVEWCSNPFLCK